MSCSLAPSGASVGRLLADGLASPRPSRGVLGGSRHRRSGQVKCDGRPNGCHNCERLQLACVGEGAVAATPISASALTLRKIRTYRSCQSCRLSKTKCSGTRPRCARCVAKALDCRYDGGSAPRWTTSLAGRRLANGRDDDDDDDDNDDQSDDDNGDQGHYDDGHELEGDKQQGREHGTAVVAAAHGDGGSVDAHCVPPTPSSLSGQDTAGLTTGLVTVSAAAAAAATAEEVTATEAPPPPLPPPPLPNLMLMMDEPEASPRRAMGQQHATGLNSLAAVPDHQASPSCIRQLVHGGALDASLTSPSPLNHLAYLQQPYRQQSHHHYHPLAWLLSPDLPPPRNLRRVVEQYFANVHPLRCFAFVHKPSFMRQLDKGLSSDDESALLHIICAHGARFLLLGSCLHGNFAPPAAAAILHSAGIQWARRAEVLLMENLGRISIQRLMTAILLHDFHFRLGEYGNALVISGLAVRMAHALKINTEYNVDVLCTEAAEATDAAPSVASRESRRRLMWACYVLDAWTGSGVDQLTLLRENDIKIQLPCNERNFGLRIPSVTETLAVGHVLPFLPPALVPRRPAANMGIMAYYIRVVALWKKIVRYVNHLHPSSPPWQPDSHFAALDADLHLWRTELPDFVEYSTETIYARLDSNQFGALVLMHCTFHHNYLELYKLTMPDLFKLPKPFAFPPEQREFLHEAQANCYYHARCIADILAEAADHGARFLSDSLLLFFVYDSSRVMLYYVARLLDPNRLDAEDKMRDAVRAVESNGRVMRLLSTLFPKAQFLANTIERWLFKVQQTVGQDDLVSSLQSEHRLDAHPSDLISGAHGDAAAVATVTGGDSDSAAHMILPPLVLQTLGSPPAARYGGGDKRTDDETSAVWSTVNPNAGNGGSASWDGTSLAAHQLVGLSQVAPMGSSRLHHGRPVPTQQQLQHQEQLHPSQQQQTAALLLSRGQPMCEALDLDDLQNFLSWDMYGIMEMGGDVTNDDMDDSVSQSWTGAI